MTSATKSGSRWGRSFRGLLPVIFGAALSVSMARDTAVPTWAFPLSSTAKAPEAAGEPHSLPGSTRQFTQAQLLDRTVAVDWYPAEHPEMPEAVRGGGRG